VTDILETKCWYGIIFAGALPSDDLYFFFSILLLLLLSWLMIFAAFFSSFQVSLSEK
jgi:hypothetical protein